MMASLAAVISGHAAAACQASLRRKLPAGKLQGCRCPGLWRSKRIRTHPASARRGASRCARGLAERHSARAGLGIGQIDGVGPDVAPSEIEHFAPAAAAECQKPDRSDGLAPLSLANVERAPEPRQLVRVKKPGDVAPLILAETRVDAALAQVPFLGPEHHRAQFLKPRLRSARRLRASSVVGMGTVMSSTRITKRRGASSSDSRSGQKT